MNAQKRINDDERQSNNSRHMLERDHFRALLEGLGVAIMITGADDLVHFTNRKMSELTGYTTNEMFGWSALDSVIRSAALNTARNISDPTADDVGVAYEIEITCRTGERKWLEMHAVDYQYNSAEPIGTLLSGTDVTERVYAEQAVQESERRLRLALETGNLGWWHLDVKTLTYLEFSDECKAHFGLPPDAPFTYEDYKEFVHPADRARVFEADKKSLANETIFTREYRIVWRDGTIHIISAHGIPVSDIENGLRFIGITQDITKQKLLESQRETALREAQKRADGDPLTGLLNHRAFHKKFEQEASRCLREHTRLAVLMMDLNNFKFFNDAYGHAVGDEVLKNTAAKLQTICRPYDVLSRFGGDEFVLLMPNIGEASAHQIEERVAKAIEKLSYRPIQDQSSIPIGASIGAAIFPDSSFDRLESLKKADDRMRWIKSGGIDQAQAQISRRLISENIEGFSMLDALISAVDNKDRYTRKHSEDVMGYCQIIAQACELDEEIQHTIAVSALIHDLGKIGVPDAILRKPGRLTDIEFAAIKLHPVMGAAIISAVPGFEDTLEAVKYHHERWDGGGYPSGLIGDETPFIARLMAVADAYSAMTTDRPYRKGMQSVDARRILELGSGTQWDPTFVHVFLNQLSARPLSRIQDDGG